MNDERLAAPRSGIHASGNMTLSTSSRDCHSIPYELSALSRRKNTASSNTMNPPKFLVVQPDPALSSTMVSILQTLGCRVEQAENDREAARMLERSVFHGVISLVAPHDPDVLELFKFVRRKYPQVGFAIQLLTSSDRFREEAVEAGVKWVVEPPMTVLGYRAIVQQIRDRIESNECRSCSDTQEAEIEMIAKSAAVPVSGSLVGTDPSLCKTLELAENVIGIDTPVLILGDRGTGKSSLARWIHDQGPRSSGPFVEFNCNCASETALEAELFGVRTVGPSGEWLQKPGKLDEAANGTLVMDEPHNLPPAVQLKLLRFLQTGTYQPAGSNQTKRSNARPLFTTRESISGLVQKEKFRQDLYYRISVVVLKLPPLCLRGNDIEKLARHFLGIYAKRLGKPVREISPDAMRILLEHGWPGNVYELESVIHRGVILAGHGGIHPNHLIMMPVANQPSARSISNGAKFNGPSIRPLKESLAEPEKQLILQALEALNWNRQETARVLDINRTTLYKKMKKYNLLTEEDRVEDYMDLA
jgi:two-component system response regulator HydG